MSRTAGSLSVGRVWHVRCHPFAFSTSSHRTQFLACGRLWVNPTTQSVLRAGILNFLLTHPHQQGAPSGCPFLCWAVLRIQIFLSNLPPCPSLSTPCQWVYDRVPFFLGCAVPTDSGVLFLGDKFEPSDEYSLLSACLCSSLG